MNFPEPFIYRIDSFIINNIRINNKISCIGTINAQFNVGGIVQNETINFILSIIMHVFWRIYNFQFGMITPFIGAALSIVGAIIGKLSNRETNKMNSIS